MLGIGADATPHDRPGRNAGKRSVDTPALAQAFHLKLLQPAEHQSKSIVVQKDTQGRHLQHDRVPDLQQGKRCGQIVFERRFQRMAVHRARALQQGVKVLRTDAEHRRQTDRTPDAEATPDPVPERKLAVLRQPEVPGGVRLCRHDHHVLCEVCVGDPANFHPPSDCIGVQQRLARREALAGDDCQRSKRIQIRQQTCQDRPVSTADEVHAGAIGHMLKRAAHEPRAGVAAADADVDDVGNRLTTGSGPGARSNRQRERPQAVTLASHGCLHRVSGTRCITDVRAQCGVQGSAMLRWIGLVAPNHGAHRAGQVRVLRHTPQRLRGHRPTPVGPTDRDVYLPFPGRAGRPRTLAVA